MRIPFFFVLLTISVLSFAQSPQIRTFPTDSLLLVSKDPKKGFHHDYLLFIPRGTPLNKKIYLLVEPNNTGKISDNMEVHKKSAIDLAAVRSVGNNISTELKIPLLVPVFPRPESTPLMYTHALDRDVILEKEPPLKRLDLQLLEMIKDAQKLLATLEVNTAPEIFMNGFSASATFTNRFSFIHPHKIKALAIGGFNGNLMLPLKKIGNVKVDYPIGLNDFEILFGSSFNEQQYKAIPQYIYMGKLDDNDAVQFDDAYNDAERKIINENIGPNVQDRYLACQAIYKQHSTSIFNSIEKVGHWTTPAMNLAVILFFRSLMN